jgi:hypothetical protein
MDINKVAAWETRYDRRTLRGPVEKDTSITLASAFPPLSGEWFFIQCGPNSNYSAIYPIF